MCETFVFDVHTYEQGLSSIPRSACSKNKFMFLHKHSSDQDRTADTRRFEMTQPIGQTCPVFRYAHRSSNPEHTASIMSSHAEACFIRLTVVWSCVLLVCMTAHKNMFHKWYEHLQTICKPSACHPMKLPSRNM